MDCIEVLLQTTVINMWPPCDTEWCNPIGRVNKLIVTSLGEVPKEISS